MAKKVTAVIKLALQAGKANPAPPVGPALGQHGVNIMAFCKEYNARTQDKVGYVIPVEISVFEDRSFTFITKTPPASVLISKAAALKRVHPNLPRERWVPSPRPNSKRSPPQSCLISIAAALNPPCGSSPAPPATWALPLPTELLNHPFTLAGGEASRFACTPLNP